MTLDVGGCSKIYRETRWAGRMYLEVQPLRCLPHEAVQGGVLVENRFASILFVFIVLE